MVKLRVYDPAMCCATGICGNSVDPKLVTFAADLEWLKKQGVNVVRYGLSFEPAEFVKNEAVKSTLQSDGNDCLPIIIVNDEIASKACYPSRAKLAEVCGLEYSEEFAGASISECNCSTAPADDSCGCGPDCDCHKSNVSNTFKKIIFILAILIMVAIVAVKFSSKAGASENLHKKITALSQINPSEKVAFIYIPTANNEKMSAAVHKAMSQAQKTLKSKNISTSLYVMSSSSSEYQQVASKTTPPAILTIYNNKSKNYVSGVINQTRLLQSYMTTTQEGGCGVDCPCHKK